MELGWHIERLAEYWENGTISDEEFAEQKQKFIETLATAADHGETVGGPRPKAPSSWDPLGEP